MLTFNTFSEREREKKKYRHYLIILLSIILSILCYGIYHNAQVELTLLEKQITLLTQKLSKNTSPTVTHLMQLQKFVNHTRLRHKYFQHVIDAMFMYSKIKWSDIEIKKQTIKVEGDVDTVSMLFSFIDYCEHRLNLPIKLQRLIVSDQSQVIKFELHIDISSAGNENAMD